MKTPILAAIVLATAAAAAVAQSPAAPTFADPVRLQAGKKFLGEGRMYPSPVVHDLNGDGLADVVIGDLPGALTFAARQAGSGFTLAAEAKVKAADGAELDFDNW